MSKELDRAREQVGAGQYKRAVSTLWEAERWARADIAEARALLELASLVRDKVDGRTKSDCDELIEDAQKYIVRATETDPRVLIGWAKYLGGCATLGSAREGRLSLSATALFLDHTKLEIALIKSIEVGGGQVAKSKVGATLAFGIVGLAAKGAQDRTELAVHLRSGEVAFFVIEDKSPFEVRAALLPVLRSAGIPFKDEVEEQAGVPGEGADMIPTHSLADDLAKLAELRSAGFLTDEELAAAKAKLLG